MKTYDLQKLWDNKQDDHHKAKLQNRLYKGKKTHKKAQYIHYQKYDYDKYVSPSPKPKSRSKWISDNAWWYVIKKKIIILSSHLYVLFVHIPPLLQYQLQKTQMGCICVKGFFLRRKLLQIYSKRKDDAMSKKIKGGIMT